MEVVSLCSLPAIGAHPSLTLPVAAVLWSTRQRGWSLTVVCKATFELAPGRLELAEQQLPIYREEQHDDEAEELVWAPADLVPSKANSDVLLVGSAYVPKGRETGSVVAHLKVGAVDKALKVIGDRIRDPDGQLGAAAKFSSRPIRYDRGVGGPESNNPAGIPAKSGRTLDDGCVLLPGIEPVTDESQLPGFGPIPDAWPTRVEKLGRHAESWNDHAWYSEPLEIDFGYFNVAPDEQQIESLASNERIELENLHPDHYRLVAELPSLAPQAWVQRRDEEPERLSMRCDTLWIDTDARVCTMTWRGRLRVKGPREALRVLVAISEDGTSMSWQQMDALRARREVSNWVDRGPDSFGAAIGLRKASEAPPQGREIEVSEPPRLSEMPPPSADPSFLAATEVLSVRGEDLESAMAAMAEEEGSEPDTAMKLVWSDPDERFAGDVFELLNDEPVTPDAVADRVLEAAEAAGSYAAPLVLCEGDMKASFDELANMRATMLAISPFAGEFPALGVLLDEARSMLSLPGLEGGSAAPADELAARLRDAFIASRPPVPDNYLDAQIHRMLVEGRKFRSRTLWGREWIRYAFQPLGSTVAYPAYMPEAIRAQLPMFGSFFARALVEVDLREDQYETHPLALRVVALARIERLVH